MGVNGGGFAGDLEVVLRLFGSGVAGSSGVGIMLPFAASLVDLEGDAADALLSCFLGTGEELTILSYFATTATDFRSGSGVVLLATRAERLRDMLDDGNDTVNREI